MKNREPIQKLRTILKEAYKSPYSDFYRIVYKAAGFVPDLEDFTVDEWRRVPFISKSDLAERPHHERAFLPIEEALFIHVSSGTTKSPVVLNLRNRLWKAYAQKKYGDRMLFFRGGAFLHYVYREEGVASICGDMKDYAATARVAGRFGVQSIMTTAPHLCALTPFLAREMDLGNIRLFVSIGDRFSPAAHAYIREHYPNAVIRNTYGTAETGGLHAQSCAEIEASGKNYVHFSEKDAFPELVDEQGKVVEKEGELVMTLLWEHNMLPIIRFKTGDIVRRVEDICSCKRETYELLGRADFDFMRIPGGLLKAEEIERTVDAVTKDIEDDYEFHVRDPKMGSLAIQVELHVRAKEGKTLNHEELARRVAEALMVGPGRTFAEGVKDGLYRPLTCKALSKKDAPSKYRRIVRDG